jgi:hypothetical protein
MQRGPNWLALRTLFHFFTGCGSLQRNAPTGGCANGIPLKLRTAAAGGLSASMTPSAVLTRSAARADGKTAPRQTATLMKKKRLSDFIRTLQQHISAETSTARAHLP